jgi:SAM-dependent methyltransferase
MAHLDAPHSPATSVADRVASLGEWITGFTLNGTKYGGAYLPETDDRVSKFIHKLGEIQPRATSILECGCLEGGHTQMLAKAFPDATIFAVDVRPESLAKARLMAELFGRTNVNFILDDFDAPKISFERRYDAVFCVGLLYHLQSPEAFLKRTCAVSPILWLWTVYCPEEDASLLQSDARGRMYDEPIAHPLSAVRTTSFWPTLGSLIEFLWKAGYTHVEVVRKEITANGAGPAVLLWAKRETDKS